MANEIFDWETLLDLTVNVVPLFIIAFFVVAFAVFSPFGIDPMASAIQFGLLVVPFVLLAVLTYFAGEAVAGTEKTGDVYLPGQASVEGAEPLAAEDEKATGVESETEAAAIEDADVSGEDAAAGGESDGAE